jgi:tungstate transport system ATP-binding protein
MPDGGLSGLDLAADGRLGGGVLAARGVGLEREGKRLLDGIDLALGAHGITIVMGPNGAGKSLLLKVLHGLVAPSRGTVLSGGLPLCEAARRRQAMVFQTPVLLRRSVDANVDFALRSRGGADPARRDALLAHVGLAGRGGQSARLLSGGEQQRLALARALATRPEVIFLDEPTASLDPASVMLFEEIVRAAEAAGTKIVFVTHDVAQARRLARDVVFLARGRLREHAPADRFFRAPASAEAAAYLAGRLVL